MVSSRFIEPRMPSSIALSDATDNETESAFRPPSMVLGAAVKALNQFNRQPSASNVPGEIPGHPPVDCGAGRKGPDLAKGRVVTISEQLRHQPASGPSFPTRRTPKLGRVVGFETPRPPVV